MDGRERSKFQMLPHARPGGIAGFLELLTDRGGRDDLYNLADELSMDVDDLLPIVEASQLLGFADAREGDVEITPEGRAFAEADIQTQKMRFRDAALKNIAILRRHREHAARQARSRHRRRVLPRHSRRALQPRRKSSDSSIPR